MFWLLVVQVFLTIVYLNKNSWEKTEFENIKLFILKDDWPFGVCLPKAESNLLQSFWIFQFDSSVVSRCENL